MRHSITIEKDIEKKIEDWRAKWRPIPDYSEAVNRLIELGLKRWKETFPDSAYKNSEK